MKWKTTFKKTHNTLKTTCTNTFQTRVQGTPSPKYKIQIKSKKKINIK